MSKYVILFTFRGESVKAMMDKPVDRAAAAEELVKSAGGSMESYYLMFGGWDGLCIAELPDSAAAAALSLRISSSSAFEHVETHELLTADQLVDALRSAEALTYAPPGS